MKTLTLSFYNALLLFILFFLIQTKIDSQWLPDQRLTHDTSVSRTSFNRSIASNGDYVHIVWVDYRTGKSEIFYKRSSDQGLSWGEDTKISNGIEFTESPSISVSGSILHVIWNCYNNGNWEIYYKRSVDNGTNWGMNSMITFSPVDIWYPMIHSLGSVVNIVWQDSRNGNWEVYYKCTTNGGLNWENDKRLTNVPYHVLMNPIVTIADSSQMFDVNVTWCSNRDGNWEIYHKYSQDGGQQWSMDNRLTYNSGSSIDPFMVSNDSIIHLIWCDSRDNNFEIYYKRSTNNGMNWSQDIRLTNSTGNSWRPTIAVSGILNNSLLHVIWQDNRDGNWEIYYKHSIDNGMNWSSDIRLTNNSAESIQPNFTIVGNMLHSIWTDTRDGNYEIYYKRNPTGNTIGINPISNEIPKHFLLEQNYPNPFNPSTKIRFSIPAQNHNKENVKLVIFDVLGRKVKEVLNEVVIPGLYEIDLDMSEYASGIYYYQLTTGSFSDTKKMMIVK